MACQAYGRCVMGVVGSYRLTVISQEVTKFVYSRIVLERRTIAGDSPVGEIDRSSIRHPSNAGHVEPRVKLGGPSPKAKYSLETDSVPVP